MANLKFIELLVLAAGALLTAVKSVIKFIRSWRCCMKYKIVKFDGSSMKKNLENMRSLHYRAGKIEPGLIPVPGTNLLFQLLPKDQTESTESHCPKCLNTL